MWRHAFGVIIDAAGTGIVVTMITSAIAKTGTKALTALNVCLLCFAKFIYVASASLLMCIAWCVLGLGCRSMSERFRVG